MSYTNELKDIESLLSQVKTITEHYDKIAEERGEKFNVFDIIGLRNDEVRMHSKFLGNLLNPRGSHGMKDVFLNKFVELINTKFKSYENLDSSDFEFSMFKDINQSIVERHTDFVSADKREGGRIDIVIEDSVQTMIIENKIYAGNQINQLVRYSNYAKKINKKYFLLYLTLDGKDMPAQEIDDLFGDCFNFNCLTSSKSEIEKVENDRKNNTSIYLPISYNIEIISWLNECIKETYEKPLLREGIKHYINLIRILTNQTTNYEMEINIKEFVISNNLEKAFLNLIEVRDKISSGIVENYIKKIVSIEYYWHNNTDIGFMDSCVTIKSWNYKLKKLELFLYFNGQLDKLIIGITIGTSKEENMIYKDDFKILEADGFYFETWTICEKIDDVIFNKVSWHDILDEAIISNSKKYLDDLINKIETIVRLT